MESVQRHFNMSCQHTGEPNKNHIKIIAMKTINTECLHYVPDISLSTLQILSQSNPYKILIQSSPQPYAPDTIIIQK